MKSSPLLKHLTLSTGSWVAKIYGKPLYYWKPNVREWGVSCNFGDLLFPAICERILKRPIRAIDARYPFPRFLAGGSLLHVVRNQDTIWGVGLHTPQHPWTKCEPSRLDIRAVRGPITRKFLTDRGFQCPQIYGDPALLLPKLFPEWKARPILGRIGFVPHFSAIENHLDLPPHIFWIAPNRTPEEVVGDILKCEFVISGSLHGLIVAEAFGIPARWLQDGSQPHFKYHDYYESTGRTPIAVSSLSQAEKLGGERLNTPFDTGPLLAAFPRDLKIS